MYHCKYIKVPACLIVLVGTVQKHYVINRLLLTKISVSWNSGLPLHVPNFT